MRQDDAYLLDMLVAVRKASTFVEGLTYERFEESGLHNKTVRPGFGVAYRDRASASRLITEAIKDGAIVPVNAAAVAKQLRYIPWWARSTVRTAS